MQLNEFLQQLKLKDYITLFGSFWDPNQKKRSEFKLWPKQEECCDFVERNRFSLLPKPRQIGVSELAAERAIKESIQHPNSRGVVFSKSGDFADAFLEEKIIPKLENLPKHKQIEWPKFTKKQGLITWSNGSTLKSISSTQTGAASLRLDYMVADEAGGIDENYGNFKQILTNSMPALDQNKQSWCMIIGTSVPGSYYNELVRTSYNDKDSEYKYFFLPWWSDPKRDQKWYEKEFNKMGDSMFLQYPRTMEDFFYVKEGLVFKEFDQKENGRHIKKIEPNWNRVFYTAYDHGYVDPAAALFGLYDPFSDHLHIFSELSYNMNHQTDVSVIARDYNKKLFDYPKRPRRQIADTAIFNRVNSVITTAELFSRSGIRWDKADKYDSEGSRGLLGERLLNNTITIDPSCIGLIEELKTWRWAKDGVTPEDKNNHRIDALRYLCTEIKPRKEAVKTHKPRQEYSFDPISKNQGVMVKGSLFSNMGIRQSNKMNSWQAG